MAGDRFGEREIWLGVLRASLRGSPGLCWPLSALPASGIRILSGSMFLSGSLGPLTNPVVGPGVVWTASPLGWWPQASRPHGREAKLSEPYRFLTIGLRHKVTVDLGS